MDFISPASDLREDLCYTDEEINDLLSEIEEYYNIKIAYQDISKILIIQDLINYVYQKKILL